MSLPVVGDCLKFSTECEECNEEWVITILAVDSEEGIWTAYNHDDDCLELYTFDENGNWRCADVTDEVREKYADRRKEWS